jgi:hypothetical protein
MLLLLRVDRQVGPAVNLEASTGMPASVSSRPDLADSQFPAYTDLKQHLQPLQIFNQNGCGTALSTTGTRCGCWCGCWSSRVWLS